MKVLESQPTPNPNAIKLSLDTRLTEQPLSFFDAASAQDHPLARAIFEIEGVTSLLLLHDFITVNKKPEVPWREITPKVKKLLQGWESGV
jgi:hypothetical protein